MAVLVYIPWSLRDFLNTGNPFFPFIFPTQNFSAWRLKAGNSPSTELNWFTSISLPISMTWVGVENAGGFATDIGPLLVILCVPAIVMFRKCWQIWFCGIILGLTWFAVGVSGLIIGYLSQPRLYFASLPAAALLAGLGWEVFQNVSFQGFQLRKFATVLVSLVCVMALIQDGADLISNGTFGVIIGSVDRKTYLGDNLGWYAPLNEKLSSLPSNTKILSLWEPRNLYAPDNFEPDYWIDRWRVDSHQHENPHDILALWKNQGFSYVLIDKPGEEFMRQADRSISARGWEELDTLRSQLTLISDVGGQYQIYSIP